MTHDELVELAQQGAAKLAEVTDHLTQATELQQKLADGLDLLQPPFVEVPELVAVEVEADGQPVIIDIDVDASGPTSVVEVGVPEPTGSGTAAVMEGGDRMQFTPGAAFGTGSSYSYTVALDDNPEVRATGRVSVEPESVVVPDPDPDPPTGAWACKSPHMGPIKKAKGKILVMIKPTSHPAMRAFGQIQHLITPAVYGMGSIFRVDDTHKHTPQGMDEHARKVWAHFKAKRWNGAKVLFWDIEGGTAYYKYNIQPKEARERAVQFHAGVMQRVIALAEKEGFKGFEGGEYNCPGLPLTGKEDNQGIYTQMQQETERQLLCPWMAFGGVASYYSGSLDKINGAWTRQDFIDRRVTSVRGAKKAFHKSQKIFPSIWAYWYSPEKPRHYPNNDPVVPAGHMKAMAEQLLAAGADGFVVWCSSGDDDDREAAARASQRYAEVVEVVRKHGGFVGP